MEVRLKIDRSKWHKPQYQGNYDADATHYEAISSRCKKCEQSFSVSAEDQKQAYEVEKRYPGWLPSLCGPCSVAWKEIERLLTEYDNSWKENRHQFENDPEYLRNWLELLQSSTDFGKKRFMSQAGMVKKVLTNLN